LVGLKLQGEQRLIDSSMPDLLQTRNQDVTQQFRGQALTAAGKIQWLLVDFCQVAIEKCKLIVENW